MRSRDLIKHAALVALAAGSVPALAQSSVTLYGVGDDAFVYSSNQNGHSNLYMRTGNLSASKFGLRGTEDLGGGMRALFVLEEGYDINTGAQSSPGLAFNRQAYVGLSKDNFGTITAGRQYTPYFLILGPLASSAALTGATGAHPGDIDGLDTTIRISNSVTYTSPVVYGLQFSGMYALGGQAGSFSAGNTISAAGRYANGPFSLAVGFLKLKNVGNPTSFSSAATGSFGLSSLNSGYASANSLQHIGAVINYKVGPVVLGATFTNVRYKPGSGSTFHDTATFNTAGVTANYFVTNAFRVGAGYSYTYTNKANGITDPAKYQQLSLIQVYALSKRTSLYATQAYQRASGQTLGAGLAGIINATPAVGDSQNGTPSSNRNQFVAMLGLTVTF